MLLPCTKSCLCTGSDLTSRAVLCRRVHCPREDRECVCALTICASGETALPQRLQAGTLQRSLFGLMFVCNSHLDFLAPSIALLVERCVVRMWLHLSFLASPM